MQANLPTDSGGVIVRRRPRLSRDAVVVSYCYEADATYTPIVDYTDKAMAEKLAAAIREIQK